MHWEHSLLLNAHSHYVIILYSIVEWIYFPVKRMHSVQINMQIVEKKWNLIAYYIVCLQRTHIALIN